MPRPAPRSYVESTAPTHFRPDLFERDPKVGVALEAHYGPARLGVPNFAVQLAALVSERAAALGKSRERVLDMGCDIRYSIFSSFFFIPSFFMYTLCICSHCVRSLIF